MVDMVLAPAGHGKTAHVIETIRGLPPLSPIRVLVPDQIEAMAFRRRLAQAGGALGVEVQTFYGLYADILALSTASAIRGQRRPDQGLARLFPAVRYRLIQHLAEHLAHTGELSYYAPLCRAAGFARMLGELFGEFKRARIFPEELAAALATCEERLSELALLYTAYQAWLLDTGWVDADGQGWLAAIALEQDPELLADLTLLAVDGFDEFNPTQLHLLRVLAGRADRTLVTLTGDAQNPARLAHRRFARARAALVEAFGEAPDPPNLLAPFPAREGGIALPSPMRGGAGGEVVPDPLIHLERNLFAPGVSPASAGDAVSFLEAQNQAAEAREALRWLKVRLVRDKVSPADVAIVARDAAPYRSFLEEAAAEFGMPLRFASGAPLGANPAIAALLNLMALPLDPVNWAPRALLDALTSPYFDWSGCGLDGARGSTANENAPLPPQFWGKSDFSPALQPRGEANSPKTPQSRGETSPLPTLQPRGKTGSPKTLQSRVETNSLQGWGARGGSRTDSFAISPPNHASDAANATRLYDVALAGNILAGLDQWRETFRRLATRAVENDEEHAPATYDEDALAPRRPPTGAEATRLGEVFEQVVARVTPPSWATLPERVAWVEELVGADPSLGDESAQERGASLHVVARVVETGATTFSANTADRDIAALRAFKDILRAQVLADSVLNEGEKPPISHGQFFSELVQAIDNATYTIPAEGEAILVASALEVRGLAFDSVALLGMAEGVFPRAEREDTLLRDADRAWLAERGIAIEPSLQGDEASFFYQAVTRACRHLLLCRPYLAEDGQPWEPSPYWSAARRLFKEDPVLHVRPTDPVTTPASEQELSALTPDDSFEVPAALLRARSGDGSSPWNGDLSALRDELAQRYGADQPWSSSRLETYAKCPFYFWAAYAMALEPREMPRAGFDVLILGSIYHMVLEQLYNRVPDGDPDRLRAELPVVASEVFVAAPNDYGFRPTPLWAHQQEELIEVLRHTLEGLIEAAGEYAPLMQELPFGLKGHPPLVLRGDGEQILRLRGYIDRVDRAPDGHLRIIDYKAGSTPISARDLADGHRLQLPLYALAAMEALNAEVADGFYWHIGSAKPSSLKLGKYAGGVVGAIKTATDHALKINAAVRAGQFAPHPPDEGCPIFCPATAFCECYKTRSW